MSRLTTRGVLPLVLVATCNPLMASDPLDAVRAAVVNGTEVHAVVTYHPAICLLGQDQVLDWPSLVLAIRDRKGVAGRLWDMCGERARKAVADDKAVADLTEIPLSSDAGLLIASVGFDLKRIVRHSDFYDEATFKGVPIDKETKALIALGPKRTFLDTIRMNRALLAAAFPKIVAPVPKDYHTIRVTVGPGKPVVLVLSAYEACRWEVTVEKGGAVAGVVLGGSLYQEVGGVGDAPVVYHARQGPNRLAPFVTDKPLPYYSSTDDPKGEVFTAAVQELTGAKPVHVQRVYSAPAEPFSVRPGKKQ